MSGPPTDESDSRTTDESIARGTAVRATATSTSFKVLGELTDSSGVGVLGRNRAGSGQPVGVRGTVPNAGDGYGLATWEYDSGSDARHMGPMAEEFHDRFGLGTDGRHISTVDANGVALAAIEGLADRLDAKDQRIDELEAESEGLRREVGALKGDLRRVRDRLDAVEDRLGEGGPVAPGGPDD